MHADRSLHAARRTTAVIAIAAALAVALLTALPLIAAAAEPDKPAEAVKPPAAKPEAKPAAKPAKAAPAKKAAAPAAPATPPELIVLPTPGATLLNDYLVAEATRILAARREAVAKLLKPEEILERQKNLRATWLDLVGPFPERTPLKAAVTGTLEREDYRIEKVIYESRPHHYVTGNLYLPKKGKPPFPCVLVPCGHSANGKAAEPYQSISQLLVLNGFVVLCYDPIGQGERSQSLNEQGKPAYGSTVEHTLADIGARLVGGSAANLRIWDGIRSIDYLTSRPEVDPKRLGCTGNSGGGTMTAYLMATDERIWAAAPSCYLTTLTRLLETIGAQDGEQCITGQIALGIDHSDYINLRAPKPTLMCVGTHDYFDIDGAWATFREAKRLYGILGFGEGVSLFEYPDKHGFSKPRREAALRWMQRWLQHVDEPTPEPALKINTDAELQVTPTGSVVRDLKSVTVWDLNLDEAKRLGPAREAFWRTGPKKDCLTTVRRMAGVRPAAGKPTIKPQGTLERPGVTIQKWIIERPERPNEPPIPALFFLPEKADGKRPAVLYVDGRGKAADALPGGAIEELVKAGHVVLAIDCRGWGETAPAKPKLYEGNEYQLTYTSIMLDRPLLGQRVEDVLAALDVLIARREVDVTRLSITGVEAAGPVALHAAALDPRFDRVALVRSIESWMDVVATPGSRNQLPQVVPAALTKYDLPDLVRSIAPRPVEVRQPADPTGKPKPGV